MLHRGPSVQVFSCVWPAPGLLQDVLLTPASGDLAKASCVQDIPETPAGAKPRPGQNKEPCPVWPTLSWAPTVLCGLQLTEGKNRLVSGYFPVKGLLSLQGMLQALLPLEACPLPCVTTPVFSTPASLISGLLSACLSLCLCQHLVTSPMSGAVSSL